MTDSNPPLKNNRSNRAHRPRDENPLAKGREVLQERLSVLKIPPILQ